MNQECRAIQTATRVAEVSGTIDGQDVAGKVGSRSLTSEEATLTITRDYKVAQRRLTTGCSGRSAARPAAEPER
jgi:hypothetical protein